MIEESASWVAVFGSGVAVPLTTVLLGVLALAVGALARRSRGLVAATGVSLAVVLGLTVVPTGGWPRFAVGPDALGSVLADLQPRAGDLTAWARTYDGPPNVVLFVPLGLCLALLLRRPLVAVLVAVSLSLVVECYQAALTTRVGSFGDVVSNGLGALVGAALAGSLLLALPPARHPAGAGPGGR